MLSRFIGVIGLFILLWGCNSKTTYKVRRIHNGHARIAHSYGKMQVPPVEKAKKIPQTDLQTTSEFIHEKDSSFVHEDNARIGFSDSNAEQVPSCKPDCFERKVRMEDTPRSNHEVSKIEMESFSPLSRSHETPDNDSMWGNIFSGIGGTLLLILVIAAALAILAVIVYYAVVLISALSFSGNLVLVLVFLLMLAGFVYASAA